MNILIYFRTSSRMTVNIHMIALLSHTNRMSGTLLNTACKALNAFNYSRSCLSLRTVSDPGQFTDMQTRYEQAAMFPLVHVWCDYLVARKVFSSFADDKTRILCAFQNIFKEESSVQVSRRLVDNTTMLRCHRTKNVFTPSQQQANLT
ncbi:hypothetical protein Plhal304r1_c026g0086861 [Plasmopara halstedii]